MQKSTVIEILRSFNNEELNEFEDFLSSPYFNKNKSINKLFVEIKKYSPGLTNENLKKEILWKKVYPGKKYNYGTVKNLIFDLNKLVLKFLELKNSELKERETDINLLQQFKTRNLKSLFLKKLKEAKKNAKEEKVDNDYFYYLFLLEQLEVQLLDYELHSGANKNDFSELNKNLYLFYINSLFINNSMKIFNSRAMRYDEETKLHFEDIISAYQKYPDKHFYSEMACICLMIARQCGNRENYYNLKKLFFENYSELTDHIKYTISSVLMNFSYDVLNEKDNLISERFIYLKLQVEEKFYKDIGHGWLDQYLFMNTVITACSLEEFDWVENFIKNNSSELMESIRDQYVNFAHVAFYLKKKNYEKALQHLSKCQKVEKQDKLNLKYYEFVIYYELGYQEEMKYLTDTTNHFLSKDKIFSQDHKESYRNFFYLINKMMEYKISGNKRSKHNLEVIKKFLESNNVYNKKWFRTRIEEFEKELEK